MMRDAGPRRSGRRLRRCMRALRRMCGWPVRRGGCNGIAASRFRLGQHDVSLPPLTVPAFGVNYGAPLRLERTLYGRRTSGSVTPGHLAILPPDADTRWIFDRTGDVVLVYVSRKVLDQAVEESMDREPRSVEIVPRFLIRDIVLERIAHQLLREIAEPRPESPLAAETLAQELAGHLIAAHCNLGAVLPGGLPPSHRAG